MATFPAAGSVLLGDLLDGPVRAATVLGVHASCVYLQVDDEVIGVETSDALGLPGAVRIAARAKEGVLSGVRRNAEVTVGSRRIALDAVTLPIVRWWQPRRPLPGTDPARVVALRRLLSGHPLPFDTTDDAARLLGRGDGLTPAGDDVIAGTLVALHHHPGLAAPYAALVETQARARTTALSATLLRQAVAGYAIPAVLALADLLAGHGDEAAMPPALARLVAVGHSSGTALAWGLLRGASEAVTKMGPAMGATDD